MQKTMSEKQLKKKLRVSDWSEMTEEKIQIFARYLGIIDPQLAREIISNFPRFAEMCETLVESANKTISDISNNDTENARMFYGSCNRLMDILADVLHSDNISEETRGKIIDGLLDLGNKMYLIELDRHKWYKRLTDWVANNSGRIAIGSLVAAGLYFHTKYTSNRDESDSNSDEKEAIPDDEYPSDDED